VAAATQGKPVRVVSVGYTEPSMAFAFGSKTVLTGGVEGVEGAVAALRQDPDVLALVQDRAAPIPPLLPMSRPAWERLNRLLDPPARRLLRGKFLAAAAQAGVPVREVGAADGWNYSRTQRVRVILYRRADGQKEPAQP
jgi:hypothetical protein